MSSAVKIVDGKKMVYIVMGVSGCGKTTIGRMLAKRLAINFYDADDFHSQNNIHKMKNFVPLDDKDRMQWLLDLAMYIERWSKEEGAVLACSALKEKYRQILTQDGKEKVTFIHLKGDRNVILERMEKRKEHFFPFRTLRKPVLCFRSTPECDYGTHWQNT